MKKNVNDLFTYFGVDTDEMINTLNRDNEAK